MSELYENLLKATSNIDDITNEKYATVTKVAGDYCSVQEEDTNLEHSQVPILNKITCETGDKVVLGFVNNSLYDPVIIVGVVNAPDAVNAPDFPLSLFPAEFYFNRSLAAAKNPHGQSGRQHHIISK